MLPTRSSPPAPARPGRVRVAILASLLSAAFWSPAAPAAPLPPDPAEYFRQALQQERPSNPTPEYLAQRRRKLEEAARSIRSLGDMSRVLLLLEWRGGHLSPQEADIDRQVRETVIEQFEQGLRGAMRRGDVNQRVAAANLIGETVSGARRQDIETVETSRLLNDKKLQPAYRYLRQRIKTMVGDLDRLARDPSPDVRTAAARSLGNIEGDPRVTAQALQRLLHDSDTAVRRAAAAALVNALQIVVQLNNERIGLRTPIEDLPEDATLVDEYRASARGEPLRSVIEFVPAAASGLEDTDAAVRRSCVDACRKGSSTLVSMTTMPLVQESEMPPKGYPLSPEDMARVVGQRNLVFALLEGMTPALRIFRNQTPLWARVATDSDPVVREKVRHVFEDLALTVQKIKHLQQVVAYPNLPPYNADEKKAAEKKVGQAAAPGVPGAVSAPVFEVGDPMLPQGPAASAAQPAVLEGPIKMTPQEAAPSGPIPFPPLPPAPPVEGTPAVGGQAKPDQKPKTEDLPPPKKLPGSPAGVHLEQALDLARGALVAGLSDRNPKVRLASVDALETMGDAAAPTVPALVRALKDPDRFVRWAASRTLGKLAPRRPDLAVPVLAGMLQPDEDLSVRLSAANTLSLFGPTAGAAVPALTRALGSRDSEVRVAALKSLESVGTDAVPALTAITGRLRDSNTQVRTEAARVLARFGPLAIESLPALRKALFDPAEEVRRAASDAILSIDVKKKGPG